MQLLKKQIVVAVDPSGNFEEGKGTTGLAVFVDGVLVETDVVKAVDFESAEAYWIGNENRIIKCILNHVSGWLLMDAYANDVTIVCESYKLQRNKAVQQSGSWLETPQLIGFLRARFYGHKTSLIFQDPTIKTRFNDSVLENMGVVEKKGRSYFRNGDPITMHERDAIRHGMYFIRYGKK